MPILKASGQLLVIWLMPSVEGHQGGRLLVAQLSAPASRACSVLLTQAHLIPAVEVRSQPTLASMFVSTACKVLGKQRSDGVAPGWADLVATVSLGLDIDSAPCCALCSMPSFQCKLHIAWPRY